MHDRLDLEHRAHHGGGGRHPAAFFQEKQIVDSEPVALAEFVVLHPVPNLFHALSLLTQLGGLGHQHPLAQRGAKGVYHKYLPVRVLGAQLSGRDLEGVAGSGKSRGKGQHQQILALLQNGFQHIGGLPHIDGVGGGHLALLLTAVKVLRAHLPVVRIVPICLIAHDESQRDHMELQLLD